VRCPAKSSIQRSCLQHLDVIGLSGNGTWNRWLAISPQELRWTISILTLFYRAAHNSYAKFISLAFLSDEGVWGLTRKFQSIFSAWIERSWPGLRLNNETHVE